MKKFGEINNHKNKIEKIDGMEDDLEFILWKAELNKELLSFWKAISK